MFWAEVRSKSAPGAFRGAARSFAVNNRSSAWICAGVRDGRGACSSLHTVPALCASLLQCSTR